MLVNEQGPSALLYEIHVVERRVVTALVASLSLISQRARLPAAMPPDSTWRYLAAVFAEGAVAAARIVRAHAAASRRLCHAKAWAAAPAINFMESSGKGRYANMLEMPR